MNKILRVFSHLALLFKRCAQSRLLRKAAPFIFGICTTTFVFTLSNFLVSHHIGTADTDDVLILCVINTVLLGKIFLQHYQLRRMKKLFMVKIMETWEKQKTFFSDEQIPDRLEVSSALEKTIQTKGADLASIETIIRYASRMEMTDGLAPVNEPSHKGKGKSAFSGFTPEFGTVKIENESKQLEPCQANNNKTRIGAFKLWRTLDVVFFQEWWRSDFSTASSWTDPYEGWAIAFNPEQLSFRFFGELIFIQPVEEEYKKELLYGVEIVSGQEVGQFKAMRKFGLR